MNLKEKRAEEMSSAQALIDGAKDRDLTADESAAIDGHIAAVKSIDVQIANAENSNRLKSLFGPSVTPDAPAAKGDEGSDDKPAKSLGEHFAKSVGQDGFTRLKAGKYTVSAPEFKAATDAQASPTVFAPLVTEVDNTIVRAYRRPFITDLLGTGTLSGNAITYFVEGAAEGAFTTVAEGAQKPQIHIADPTTVTDTLKKIAAWFDVTDEMADDVPFWVSEVNNRGIYLLQMFEEAQLLSGNGTGTNLLGMFNRSGVQTLAQAATNDSAQDAIFRGITAVQTATGLVADGIVINPADYMALRLSKDSNNQYYGGGFFVGEYGIGGVAYQPPLWGLKTVVSAAVPAKTVAVGAFKAATTVYRKGGIRVESTNSDLGKFTKNIVTTRIEERIALAVRVPSAIVKVTLQ